ncbi:MAG: hypothetical protein MI919_01000 [Holophagales bacterium]|nr:hypothetical protein [Holophagales bacterium]
MDSTDCLAASGAAEFQLLGRARSSAIQMLICNDLELSPWTPDFSSSGQSNPRWTRASCRGLQLANSVEGVDWSTNPVQVVLCEACGYPDCGPANYVHVPRLDDLVLWSVPHIDESDDWQVLQLTANSGSRLGIGSILAVTTGGSVTFGGALGRSWAPVRLGSGLLGSETLCSKYGDAERY